MKITVRVEQEPGSKHLHRVLVLCEEAGTIFNSGKIYQSEPIHGAGHSNQEARRLAYALETLGHEVETQSIELAAA